MVVKNWKLKSISILIYNTRGWYITPWVRVSYVGPLTGDPGHYGQVLRGVTWQRAGEQSVISRDHKWVSHSSLIAVASNWRRTKICILVETEIKCSPSSTTHPHSHTNIPPANDWKITGANHWMATVTLSCAGLCQVKRCVAKNFSPTLPTWINSDQLVCKMWIP